MRWFLKFLISEVREKILRVERLGENWKVVSCLRSINEDLRGVLAAGEEYHSDGGAQFENRKRDLDAIHRLHHHVGEKHIERELTSLGDSLFATKRGDGIESANVENHDEGIGDSFVPIDDKDPEFTRSHGITQKVLDLRPGALTSSICCSGY